MPIKYRDGYKYQLAENYGQFVPIFPHNDILTEYITLTKAGRLIIKEGYAWDGASGPTIDTKSSMRGSLVHDALYQLMRLGLLGQEWRHAADDILRDICVESGMFRWRARLWHDAVREGAGYAADPKNDRPVLVAP